MRNAFLCAFFVLMAPLSHAQISLPVTFEEGIDYELTDFGGNMSQLVADPEDAANTVVASERTAAAECFAGTTVANASGFAEPIPFAPGETKMNVRVWSPEAGVRVLFKVEEVGVPEINVETFSFTSVAMAWETIVFDFGNPMPNTNPINFDNTYNKASIFFDFQCNLPPTASGPGTYYWDDVAFGDVMPVASEDGGLPLTLELTQNYPNPFGSSTTIRFSLPSAEYVGIYVYNVLGQRVATLVEETMEAGDHTLPFDASGLASGTYFYRLSHGAGSLTRSMVLTR